MRPYSLRQVTIFPKWIQEYAVHPGQLTRMAQINPVQISRLLDLKVRVGGLITEVTFDIVSKLVESMIIDTAN